MVCMDAFEKLKKLYLIEQKKKPKKYADRWYALLEYLEQRGWNVGRDIDVIFARKMLEHVMKECIAAGDFSQGDDWDVKRVALSNITPYNVALQSEYYLCDFEEPIRAWFAYPQDHLFCRIAGFVYHETEKWKRNERAERISLRLGENQDISAETVEEIRRFSNETGTEIEVFKKVGRVDHPVFPDVKSAKEYCEQNSDVEYDDSYFEDDFADDVGNIYLDILSGKKYVMESDWFVKTDRATDDVRWICGEEDQFVTVIHRLAVM